MKYVWFVGAAMISTFCHAAEPIKDKDRFEADYLACIQAGFKNNCWVNVFSGHSIPWADGEAKSLRASEAAYKEWLGDQAMYKVHIGSKEIKGEIYDNRSYVMERDDGSAVGLWISFRQVKGKWYFGELLGSSSDEFIRTSLGIKRPQEK